MTKPWASRNAAITTQSAGSALVVRDAGVDLEQYAIFDLGCCTQVCYSLVVKTVLLKVWHAQIAVALDSTADSY